MSTLEDARRITLSLPVTQSGETYDVWNGKKFVGFAWPWNERVELKKPKVRNFAVLAIRTADLEEKEALLASDPEKFFTEPHYNNFPAVLVRIANVDSDELQELLTDAWRTRATRQLIAEFDARAL